MNKTQVDAQTAYYFCREDFENTNKISKNTTIIYHPSHNRSLQYYGYTILYHDFELNRLDISMGGWNYGVPHRRINSVLEFMFTRGYLPRLWQLEKKGEEIFFTEDFAHLRKMCLYDTVSLYSVTAVDTHNDDAYAVYMDHELRPGKVYVPSLTFTDCIGVC